MTGCLNQVGIDMEKKMYSYGNLGMNGRFGNQMFQYATLFSVAKANGEDLYIPVSITRHDFPLEGEYEILSAFPALSAKRETRENIAALITGQYKEPGFSYDPNVFLIRNNTDLHGYFQSEMYFSEYRKDILREFEFSDEVKNNAASMLESIRSKTSSRHICSLHIRRGDYQNSPDYHTNLDGSYYNVAMNHILSKFKDVKFLVFSDDIEWCKNNLPSGVEFSALQSQFEDMCAMTLCDSHITANSSFSWWGSWMANSKCTIAPKAWFGPKGPPDWSTIYSQGWLIA